MVDELKQLLEGVLQRDQDAMLTVLFHELLQMQEQQEEAAQQREEAAQQRHAQIQAALHSLSEQAQEESQRAEQERELAAEERVRAEERDQAARADRVRLEAQLQELLQMHERIQRQLADQTAQAKQREAAWEHAKQRVVGHWVAQTREQLAELADQQTEMQQALQREAAAAEAARQKDAEERAAMRAQLRQLKQSIDAELKQSIEECTKARRAAVPRPGLRLIPSRPSPSRPQPEQRSPLPQAVSDLKSAFKMRVCAEARRRPPAPPPLWALPPQASPRSTLAPHQVHRRLSSLEASRAPGPFAISPPTPSPPATASPPPPQRAASSPALPRPALAPAAAQREDASTRSQAMVKGGEHHVARLSGLASRRPARLGALRVTRERECASGPPCRAATSGRFMRRRRDAHRIRAGRAAGTCEL